MILAEIKYDTDCMISAIFFSLLNSILMRFHDNEKAP